jgi:hypothetical protein
MKTLVIIPTLLLDCSFSAPLAWMFAKHADRVKGVYGFELTRDMVLEHEQFIVELNWFVELHEFGLIVDFIRRNNRSAKILFGGMYAGIRHREIFQRYDVDHFILGDNELPIGLFVESVAPREIPNCVGRDFANPISYAFTEDQYGDLDFDLSWFPSYFKYRRPGDQFLLPHIITTKGGCNAVHDGCDYCMGSKHDVLRGLYNRPPITMTNDNLMRLLDRAQRKFNEASLYLTRAAAYDFSGKRFELDMTIEVDSQTSIDQIASLCRAFRKVFLLVSAYEEGISGSALDQSLFKRVLELEDADHRIRFYVFKKDAKMSGIPNDHIMYSEFAFPKAADWSFYVNLDHAIEFSRRFYDSCNRHFADGVPNVGATNPNYISQCFHFSKDFLCYA